MINGTGIGFIEIAAAEIAGEPATLNQGKYELTIQEARGAAIEHSGD